jgi:drug/metabolite transporter (DMT)-like permease
VELTTSVIALTVLSGLCWSLFDAGRKELTTHLRPWTLLTAIMAGQALCYVPLLFTEPLAWPTPDYLRVGLMAVFFNVGASVLFLLSVKRAPLSVTVPMLSFSPVFASIGGWLFLKEVLQVNQWVGIGLIVAATILFALSDTSDNTGAHSRRDVWVGMGFMLAVAFLFALIPLTDKVCLQYAGNVVHGMIQCVVLGVIFAMCVIRYEATTWHELVAKIKLNQRWLAIAVIASVVAILSAI